LRHSKTSLFLFAFQEDFRRQLLQLVGTVLKKRDAKSRDQILFDSAIEGLLGMVEIYRTDRIMMTQLTQKIRQFLNTVQQM
jgi:hypothetical protein